MKVPTTTKYKGLTEKESFLLRSLAREDKKIFTIKDAEAFIENPKKVIHSLSKKGWILGLKRGMYAIVPLEIGPKGADAFTIHDFVIASHLAEPYYIGYWSALNYHGLTDEIPRTVFIATLKPKKSLKILYSEFYFVKLTEKKFFGYRKTGIEGEKINISDREKTIADCLDHPEHAGGIEEVARSIYFNHKEIDFGKVEKYIAKMGNLTALKRLGYITEACGIEYKIKTKKLSKGYGLLDTLSPKEGTYDRKWKLLINKEISPKRWMY